jgi:hypothetical protein
LQPCPEPYPNKGGERTITPSGPFGYWAGGPDVAIFYRHDGERIPDPGLIVLGKVKAGVEVLDVPGAIEATIELV